MAQEKICYIIFFALTSILLDDVFAASTNRANSTLVCAAPTGNTRQSVSTICCADMETQGSNSYHICTKLSNKNGNLYVNASLQSEGVVLKSVISSTGPTCGSITPDSSETGEEACIDVLSYNATAICFRLSVRDNSGTGQSSPVSLSLPSLKPTRGTGQSRDDFLMALLGGLFNGSGKA